MTKILKGSWLLIRYTFVRNIFSLKRLIFVSQLKFIRCYVILDYTVGEMVACITGLHIFYRYYNADTLWRICMIQTRGVVYPNNKCT